MTPFLTPDPRPLPFAPVAVYSPDQLAGLPAPVARYFERVLQPGQRMIRAARIEQRGDFALSRDRWMPFTATESVSVRPLGFTWDASIRVAPLVTMRVRDGYVDGTGTMEARLAGLIPVVRRSGGVEMAKATLQRYLAEAPWIPTALLPSEGVHWTPLDDSSARATITDRGVSASVDFHFAHDGTVAGVSTERYRDVKRALVLTPWRGAWRAYERVDGMLVPREGDVSWELDDGPLTYWRGRVDRITYS